MVAKRGIMFEFQTSVSPAAAKAFEALEKRAEELQKRMNLTLNVVERGRRNRSNGANGTNGNGTNGSSAVSNADIKAAERAAQARERAAERAFRTEARWNRQAEAAIARREAAEEKAARSAERDAKRAADAKIREAKRAEQATQKEFAAAARRQKAEALREQKADREFWKGVERFGEDRAKAKKDSERKETAEERKIKKERKEEIRERKRDEREAIEAQNKIREGVYGTVHAFGQLTRAAAQFGLVGQRDMSRVLDTIFAVEGSINALQGVMGAARAIGGMRGAGGGGIRKLGPAAALSGGAFAKDAAHLLKALGIRSFGVAGGLGLVGAGVGTAALGTLGLMGAMIDRRRGVAGNVGGFWDTIGGALNAPVGFVNRGLMGIGSKIERSFNASYGLTQFQNEERSLRLHEAEFNRDFGAEEGRDESPYAAKKRADLAEERTQLLERRTKARLDAREVMRERHELIDSTVGRLEAEQRGAGYRLAEQRYGIRAGNLQRRGAVHGQLLNEAFGRQREAFGEQLSLRQARALGQFASPEQTARAAAEAAREEGLTTSHDAARLNNLRLQHTANLQRGREIGQEFHAARMRLAEAQGDAGSPAGRENAAQEMAAADERLKQNAEERAKLEEQIRRVGIDGAQRQLQLREQSLATAKQTADTLRQQNQSAKERFGQLLPSQQRSILDAARDASQGGELSRHRANQLRQFPELFGERLRQHDVQRAELGGYGDLEKFSGMRGRINKAEGVEQREMKLTVDQRAHVTGELHFDATHAAQEIANLFVPLLQRAHEDLVRQVDQKIKDANREMTRRQNMQGRQGAGG